MKRFLFIISIGTAVSSLSAGPYTWIAAWGQQNPNIQNNAVVETQAIDSALALTTSGTPDQFAMIKSLAFCISYGILTDYLTRDIGSYLYDRYRDIVNHFVGMDETLDPLPRIVIYGATIGTLYAGCSYFNTEFQAMHDTLVKT